MANIIKIKRGSGVPASGNLSGSEFGWDYTNDTLYIGVEGASPIKVTDAFSNYLSINKTTGKISAATSALEVGGVVDFNATLTVDGITLINNALTATGLASLDGGIDVNNSNFTVGTAGNIATTGTLTVDGGTTLGDSADDINVIRGVVTISDIGRITTVKGTLEVDQTLGVDGDVRVGTAGTSKLVVNSTTGNISTMGTLDVDGAVEFNTTLGVDGAATLRNTLNVSAASTLTALTVNSTAQFNDNLTTTVAAITTLNGPANVNNTLDVTGLASLDGGIDVNSKLTIAGATGNIATVGNVTAQDVTVNGNLLVHGGTTTVQSNIVTINDPVFSIGEVLEISDAKDRGIEFKYGTTLTPYTGFFGLDESTGRFTFIPNATNTSEVFTGTPGSFEIGHIFQGGVNVSNGWNAAVAATSSLASGVQYDLLQHNGTNFVPTKTISAAAGITIDCGSY